MHVADSLFVYFKKGTGLDFLGAFTIVRPQIPAALDAPALGVVIDAALEAALTDYKRDPYLGLFTGFFLRPDAYAAVPSAPPVFVGQNALRASD